MLWPNLKKKIFNKLDEMKKEHAVLQVEKKECAEDEMKKDFEDVASMIVVNLKVSNYIYLDVKFVFPKIVTVWHLNNRSYTLRYFIKISLESIYKLFVDCTKRL